MSLLVVVADTDATADQNGFDVVFILSTDIELGTIYFDFNIADFDNKRLFFIFTFCLVLSRSFRYSSSEGEVYRRSCSSICAATCFMSGLGSRYIR